MIFAVTVSFLKPLGPHFFSKHDPIVITNFSQDIQTSGFSESRMLLWAM